MPIDPTTPPVQLLHRFGPDAPGEVLSPDACVAYCRGLARTHYENFSVLTSLVPPDLRDDFAAVYAFCRWADDLADETGSDDEARRRSQELLTWWAGQVHELFDGKARHPVFVALSRTHQRHGLPRQPLLDLIDAFQQDQWVRRYQTWDELVGYCRRSADPVGRLVLHLTGYPESPGNAELLSRSDAICTALQLTNFWQDVRRDLLERDRVYLPAETGVSADDLRAWADRPDDHRVRLRYIRALRPLVERTGAMFEHGAALPGMLDGRAGPLVWLFAAGGRRVLTNIERHGCATLWVRPTLSTVSKGGLLVRAWLRSRIGQARSAPRRG